MHHPPLRRTSAMCGFATKETLVGMDLPVQQGKTKPLRVFQFRKEELSSLFCLFWSCAGGRLAKSRNVAIKTFQEQQRILVRKLESLARYLWGIPWFQMFSKTLLEETVVPAVFTVALAQLPGITLLLNIDVAQGIINKHLRNSIAAAEDKRKKKL